jgi:histone chaperone ASF1
LHLLNQVDLEWKLVYVGSSENKDYDQVLDSVMVGPVTLGPNQFVFTADAPDHSKIPVGELLDSTVLLIEGFYNECQFVQVGYFVNNEYTDPELKQNPPSTPDVTKIQRSILADQPRITTFPIEVSSLFVLH